MLFSFIPILSVILILVLFLYVLLFDLQRKNPGEPLAELDHRNPAVHSQGPLLLLAVSRADLVGQREGERVGGRRRSAGAVGGTDFPAVCPHALPPCQRLSRSAGTRADTKKRDKTADRKWIEVVLLKGDRSHTQATELFFVVLKFLLAKDGKVLLTTGMCSGIRHKPAGVQCLNTPTNPLLLPCAPFIFPHHLTNPCRLSVCGGLFYQ